MQNRQLSPKSSTESFDREFGSLIIYFAWGLLLEGVLRKWVLNSIEAPLIFIRDPIVIAIYIKYLSRYGLTRPWARLYLIYMLFMVLLALLQTAYWGYDLIVPIMGLRYYTFYIPLAFMIGDALTGEQLHRLVRMLLLVSIPIAGLVLAQFESPLASDINKGLNDDIEGRFSVVDGIARPYGPFPFVSAQNNFAALMLSILLIAYEQRREWSLSPFILTVSGFSIITMGALSGGRTYFGSAILIVSAYLIAGLTSRDARIGVMRVVAAIFAGCSFIVVFVFVFPDSFDAMSKRQADAVYVEGSTISRAIDSMLEFVDPIASAPIFGFGLGAGSNAARSAFSSSAFSLGENEWPRMINELGPVFGLPILSLRCFLVVTIAWAAFAASRTMNSPAGLILFGFSGYLLLTGQITLQNQLASICWFAVGLTLSFVRIQNRKLSQ